MESITQSTKWKPFRQGDFEASPTRQCAILPNFKTKNTQHGFKRCLKCERYIKGKRRPIEIIPESVVWLGVGTGVRDESVCSECYRKKKDADGPIPNTHAVSFPTTPHRQSRGHCATY